MTSSNLDELLEERLLFIAHEAAFTWSTSQMAQAIHRADGIREKYGPFVGALMGHTHCAVAAYETARMMHAMREAGHL